MPYELQITPEKANKRLDKVCAVVFKDHTRAQWAKYGVFMLENTEFPSKTKTKAGQIWQVEVKEPKTDVSLTPWECNLSILHETEDFLVIDKPIGVSVHPSASEKTHKTVVNALLYMQKIKNDDFEEEIAFRPGVVHRIDKTTSGCVLIAKNKKTLAYFQANWKTYTKVYGAVVSGRPPKKGTIEAPIARDPKNRQRMAVVHAGRPSTTHFERQQTHKNKSVLKVTLETGRTHQIRVHLASIGHAIVGDAMYNGPKAERIYLHAASLRFKTPQGDWITVESPLPPQFKVENE